MKKESPHEQTVLPVTHRVMLTIIAFMIGLLILGTIYGLVRPSWSRPLFTLGKSTVTEQAPAVNDSINIFTGMGQLRVPLSNSSTLILSIAFPYPAGDITFTEELAGKIGELRSIAIDYFSSLPADKLAPINEEDAKTEILKRYNAALRLGRIEALYFSDLITIDASQ